MRTLDLYIPRLLPDAFDGTQNLPAALAKWLARSRLTVAPCASHAALLCRAFDLHGGEASDLPTGALGVLGEDADAAAEADRAEGFWLHADPVHLLARRTDLVLIDAPQLAIAADEARALVAALNLHFNADGMQFVAPAPTRWYLRLAAPVDLRTTSLEAAAGHSVDPLLPRGADALSFARRCNEAQMLLHAHPVNAARAARGQPEINSLWFWGAGSLPTGLASAATWWADEPLVRGLVRRAGGAPRPCPDDAARWLDSAPAGAHAVVLPQPPSAPQQAQARLQQVAQAWLAPLLEAVAQGSVREAALLTYAGTRAWAYRIVRGDLWKFWRRRVHLPRQQRVSDQHLPALPVSRAAGVNDDA